MERKFIDEESKEKRKAYMKILTDTHTHTNCSDHAFSTVAENLAMAKQRGLDLI